jgi:hypothetical protein
MRGPGSGFGAGPTTTPSFAASLSPQPLARLVHAEPHEDVADGFPVGSVLGAALGFCQGDGFASVPDASLGSRNKCFGQVPNLQKPTRELRGSCDQNDNLPSPCSPLAVRWQPGANTR